MHKETRNLTFPSMTATHELVVPKSIPIISLPVGFELQKHMSFRKEAFKYKSNFGAKVWT